MLSDVAPSDKPVRIGELLERSQSMLLASGTDPEHQAGDLKYSQRNIFSVRQCSEGRAAAASTPLNDS